MNKYQKIASKVAKDMVSKDVYKGFTYNRAKNASLAYFREVNMSIKGALAYKNYFKDKWY